VNAVSRFDAARQKREQTRFRQYAFIGVYVAGGLIGLALLFQLFFRYQYLTADGVTWRIDRLTQQTCRVSIGQAQCMASSPSATVSTSTSTSTSTSLSTSLKVAAPSKHAKPH